MNALRRAWLRSVAACIVGVCGSAQALADLLQPDEAFGVSARRIAPDLVELEYLIAPGYHLYRDRFTFSTDHPVVTVAAVDLPPALERFDPAIGKPMRYYRDRLTVRVRLSAASQAVRLTASAQGCAADLGVCYPPVIRSFELPAAGARGRG